jgi:nucleoid-associated protein YgaU
MHVRTATQAGNACYTVKKNDSLYTIAGQFYGDASYENVMKIYYSNLAAIGPDPSVVRSGMHLYIPI